MSEWIGLALLALGGAILVYWIERRRMMSEGKWIAKNQAKVVEALYREIRERIEDGKCLINP